MGTVEIFKHIGTMHLNIKREFIESITTKCRNNENFF